MLTRAVPSRIRKKPIPFSPSRAMTAPPLWLTSLVALAIAWSSFFVHPENSGTLDSSPTASWSATSRSSHPDPRSMGDSSRAVRGRGTGGGASSPRRRLGDRNEGVVRVEDGLVALAGGRLQPRPVQDGDLAPPVLDESRSLQHPGRNGHRGAPHRQHVGQELLGQHELVRTGPVVGLEQPPGTPLPDRMRPVARHALG